ncbi:MAG: Glu-tRNA(Gln) amidotransferase subunit GatE [Gemmatimonadetes bacterium]|uniref:Glu-tRNA(Gln) amidotransferase subunit GatE n=1 Tax=Candidatus Kutchimonas denitrificans TaxID=3056748 RepID=A0AAE5CDM2_9BACT|nr:Glu-tRNA(Gln) amidotransferase subunit GatE [Gemmatimonadota bacterium]NIR76064.1 Glu-tRNA(Gln) amidotransferase subunit GatE [Candidatus Kutchimonas denitrificans]NIS00443.1 Glu-tRNA(Gln) amidotransferase subunit GatE [Gemmatimonadota bacterium]NIT66101.1 Glu-tRNA(Gln) amidotransferase subunit GatE [Gemmatimonadota bacterium]NIU54179.1 Glu-tRNA(Gln) amidotransferase subunit GatE [Gemmatimonadota bacterium]
MSQDLEPKQYGVRPPPELNPRTDPVLDFPDADYGELEPEDYRTLGFMSGLEVHQQLLTRSKLFCRCPAGRYVDEYDAEVLRHMRPTLSELGEYDGTALMEFKTRKEIVYQLERGSVCTYEMDDTPPFEIDGEAVRIAIEIAELLDLNLVSELHVMRKQYLDGSIPTGFQRTAMVGLTGTIPFRVPELGVNRELRIRQLSLEEDACREIADVGHYITFRTDRLGMPLTETVTEPDLANPLEVQAAGRLLARVVQATGKVRRGPGAARQDVNVSVAGGRRIEIKGVDNHRNLPRLVHVEAYRQLNLLRVRAELQNRGVDPEMLTVPETGLPWEVTPHAVDAASAVSPCEYAPIRDALEREEKVIGVRLPGFGGLLGHRTQPGVTFAREFADRIRVIACPVHRPFIIHSDLTDYGLDPRQWRALSKQLRVEQGDVMVVVWMPESDAATAVREIFIRAREALVGIPAETRQAFSDGTTGFERILPGPDRMYPDTDTPPVRIRDELVLEVREGLPETPWARESRYEALGLDPEPARRLAAAPWAELFDALAPAPGAPARRFADVLETRIPHHRRNGAIDYLPSAQRLDPLVRAVESGAIRPEAMERALDDLIDAPDRSVDKVLAPYRPGPDDDAELERAVADAAARAEALAGKPAEAVLRWAMGEVMPRFLGRVDPSRVRQRLIAALQLAGTEVAG